MKKFITASVLLAGLAFMLIGFVWMLYSIATSGKNSGRTIIIVITIILALIALIILSGMTAAVIIIKNGSTNRALQIFLKLISPMIFPMALFVAELPLARKAGLDKDSMRKTYVELNNAFVSSEKNKKNLSPEKILLLLPHCLQNSECTIKVSGDIRRCRQCGKCCLGDILKTADKYGVGVVVATGGTAARSAILKKNPSYIISVACERDLASGISDVRKIPVKGIINKRPNGPCINTTVDLNELENALKEVTKTETKL